MLQVKNILTQAHQKLYEMREMSCFSEIYNIIHSLEPNNLDEYKKAAKMLDLAIGAQNKVIINKKSAVSLASVTLTFMKFAEDENPYPIFFNQQRENILLKYITQDLYLFKGFETIYELHSDNSSEFYRSLKKSNTGYIIDSQSAIFLINIYQDFLDFDIAVSSYLFMLRSNKKLLGNFKNTAKMPYINNIDDEIYDTLKAMASSQRLDALSAETIKKALEVIK